MKKEGEKLMVAEVNRKELVRALDMLRGISFKKTTLPVLANVLLEVTSDSITITGTDLAIAFRRQLPASDCKPGKASVPAKMFYDILKELSDEAVHLERMENFHLKIKTGEREFGLVGLDTDEFPVLPEFDETKFSIINAEILSSMIEKTVFAASNEESQYHLNGLLLCDPAVKKSKTKKERVREVKIKVIKTKKVNHTLRLVGTDGHRLSLVQRDDCSIDGLRNGVILPKPGALFLLRVLKAMKEVGVQVSPTHIFFKTHDSLGIVRLVDGEFPDYEAVIPKGGNKVSIALNKKDLYSCMKRMSTMSGIVEAARFSVEKNKLIISVFNQDYGEAKETITVGYEGIPVEIGLNMRYVMDALNSFNADQILMEVVVPPPEETVEEKEEIQKEEIVEKESVKLLGPIIFKAEGAAQLSLVMPIRL